MSEQFKIRDNVILERYDLEPIEVEIVDIKEHLYYLSDGSRVTKDMLHGHTCGNLQGAISPD